MNEELQTKLLQYIDKLEGGIDKAVEFSADQAPIVVQELLRWHLVSHTVYGCLLLLSISVCARFAIITGRICKQENLDDILPFMSCILALFLWFPCVWCFMCALHVLIAPRLVVLEQLSKLVP